jgi:hypothetical protein
MWAGPAAVTVVGDAPPPRAVRRWRLAVPAVAVLVAAGVAAPAHAAQWSVSTTADSGPGSLRQAVLDANAAPGPDAIAISVTGTVSLASALAGLSDDVTIAGPGADRVAIARGAAAPFGCSASIRASRRRFRGCA